MSTSPAPPPPSAAFQPGRPMRPIPTLLPVFIIFFLFLCFLSVFLFRNALRYLSAFFPCFPASLRRHGGPTQNNNAGAAQGGAEPGLDLVIVSSFPTLLFSDARGLQEGKCGVECAVCLSEFNGGDVIRLLTVCCHAFHQTCIDSWLAMHTTCPVCRSDLKVPPDEAAVLAVREIVGGAVADSHVIVVEEETKANSREHLGESEHEQRREGEEERRDSGREERRNAVSTAEPP